MGYDRFDLRKHVWKTVELKMKQHWLERKDHPCTWYKMIHSTWPTSISWGENEVWKD